MSIMKRIRAAAMTAVIALTACSLTGCKRGVSEVELKSIIADMNKSSNNDNYGNNADNNNYGNNVDNNNDFGENNTDHYPGNAAAGNHQYEESSSVTQTHDDEIQPGTAIVEWNGVQHNAAASYENNSKTFNIRAEFDGKHIAMSIYKDKVGEGDILEDADGDFIYDNKIGFVSFVDFPTKNGTVYSGGTNLSTMYDLNYFDTIYLKVNKYDPNGITEFVLITMVDMGLGGEEIFKVNAAVDVNSSQSYGSGGGSIGGNTGGGDYGSDKCGYCHGAGTCQVCGGLRRIYVPSYTGEPGTYVNCSSCNGSGKCEWCGGTGKR